MEQTKIKMLEAIRQSENEINEPDLKDIQQEFARYIDNFLRDSSRFVGITINEDQKHNSHFWKQKNDIPRIVIIGDIHCDFVSIKGIIQKLCISDYDYFNKAVFVFLGDYIDRGALPLQTLRLIFRFRDILGDRCILLRGNHDIILHDDEKGEFYSNISPAETIELMKEYFETNTINKFKEFFDIIPFFVSLERNDRKYILVHGGIPKDIYANDFNSEMISRIRLPFVDSDETHQRIKRLLNSMLWGDPSDAKYKVNSSSSRFEFGSEQFDNFLAKTGHTHMIRAHEPKTNGFEPKYNNRLFTVFSSGGNDNPSSFYADNVLQPSFVLIYEDGSIQPESIFTYLVICNQPDSNEILPPDFQSVILKINPDEPYRLKFENSAKASNTENKSNNLTIYLNKEFAVQMTVNSIPAFLLEKLFKFS